MAHVLLDEQVIEELTEILITERDQILAKAQLELHRLERSAMALTVNTLPNVISDVIVSFQSISSLTNTSLQLSQHIGQIMTGGIEISKKLLEKTTPGAKETFALASLLAPLISKQLKEKIENAVNPSAVIKKFMNLDAMPMRTLLDAFKQFTNALNADAAYMLAKAMGDKDSETAALNKAFAKAEEIVLRIQDIFARYIQSGTENAVRHGVEQFFTYDDVFFDVYRDFVTLKSYDVLPGEFTMHPIEYSDYTVRICLGVHKAGKIARPTESTIDLGSLVDDIDLYPCLHRKMERFDSVTVGEMQDARTLFSAMSKLILNELTEIYTERKYEKRGN